MMRKSMLVLVLALSLALALVGLTGCRSKDPVVVTPPVATVEDAPEPEPTEPILWPLTGLEAESEEDILARPLSVKFDNHPSVTMQLNVNHADVVIETLAEGGVTRFNGIFQSDIPEEVMPVRSARDSDLIIVPQYGDALFFYSGANQSVLRAIREAGLASMSHSAIGGELYRRAQGRAPHNLAVNLARAYEVAEQRGFDIVTEEPIKGFDFRELGYQADDAVTTTEANDNGTASNAATNDVDTNGAETNGTEAEGVSEPTGPRPASSVGINFSAHANNTWDWDSENEVWTRTSSGRIQYSGEDEQITTNNLVVIWADHSRGSIAGTYAIDMAGEGNASIFMDGKRIDGTWEGFTDRPPVFKDESGAEILLIPGRTWMSVMQPGENINSSE